MDEQKELLKVIISRLAMYLLPKLIPWLGTLIGLPGVGWIIGLLVGWLAGKLSDAIAVWVKYKQIDAQVKKEVDTAKAASDALIAVQNNPTATKEEHEKAKKAFADAYRDLIRVRVQPS